ncbi:Hydrogenase nickel incorporation protein hupN [Bradyrhizobium sp. STM 3843]|uniref:HoxN/HupN/NixA family nickel/cobalt transporter n=1 Tax=Bradyrhizobium sp. STM 3843 TaxID=551947 RepID=UPI00024049E2|nr:HoxN/HupN/NixA family nickel/cobalt transporter [Bradyrhizobium sp. STM 3843]CCE11072.1 Hydrogenase nickel incorporation protein hupN [Bradyrhizobium sp. STM 3843]
MTILANDHPARRLRDRTTGPAALAGGLLIANGLAWAWAFALYSERPAVVGTALLAWLLGLRHAVDADHIAAIDNVVRKLMHAGEMPRASGLYFALGHSSVVVAATILLASMATIGLADGDSLIRLFGSAVGTSVSAAFLLLIASANLVVLFDLWRKFRSLRQSDQSARNVVAISSADPQRGFLVRVLRPLLRMVSRPWHMYPLGLVFGLGFDTASEIGLLSLSATEAARGTSLLHVLVFPALFAAAMATVDAADSVLMTAAYRWALTDPHRKLRYNLAITAASVTVAFVIGGIEAAQLLGTRFGLVGSVWDVVGDLNAHLADLGIVVIGLLGAVWIGSMLINRGRDTAASAVECHRRHPDGAVLASVPTEAQNHKLAP